MKAIVTLDRALLWGVVSVCTLERRRKIKEEIKEDLRFVCNNKINYNETSRVPVPGLKRNKKANTRPLP